MRIRAVLKELNITRADVIDYCKKKYPHIFHKEVFVKLKEWKPTMQEFERKLESLYGVEIWFLDWVRTVVNMKNKKEILEARHIYEWLKSNENWLYELKIGGNI